MLDRLIRDPLFAALCAAHDDSQGNLLELTERQTAAAQIATFAWLLSLSGPPSVVVETGTNKALFGFLLTHLLPVGHSWQYHTIDPNPRAGDAARILADHNRHISNIDVYFYHGSSAEVLPLILPTIATPDLAWVDGDHSAAGVTADLDALAAAGARLIVVDDVALIPEVGDAVAKWTKTKAGRRYNQGGLAFPGTDPAHYRGIAVLVRREADAEPDHA